MPPPGGHRFGVGLIPMSSPTSAPTCATSARRSTPATLSLSTGATRSSETRQHDPVTTTRKALWTDDGLDIVERELPPLHDGWARVRVEACGICGSDLHFWTGHTPRP